VSTLEACRVVGDNYRTAKQATEMKRNAARTVAVAACDAGVPEAAVARAVGVTRNTIRTWRSK